MFLPWQQKYLQWRHKYLHRQAPAEDKAVPADETMPNSQMQGLSSILQYSCAVELAAYRLNSCPSLESQNTKCCVPTATTSSAGGVSCGIPGLTLGRVAVSNKAPSFRGARAHTYCGSLAEAPAAVFTSLLFSIELKTNMQVLAHVKRPSAALTKLQLQHL